MQMLKLLNTPFPVLITNTLSPQVARSDETVNVTDEEEEVVVDGSKERVEFQMSILVVSELIFPGISFTLDAVLQ